MTRLFKVLQVGALLCLGGQVQGAESLTFASWGGTTQQAQVEAWAVPFEKQSGVHVESLGPTGYARFRAMVESGKVIWDVVDVEAEFALRAGREGLLEPLDLKAVDQTRIDPRFVTVYGVGSFYFSFVLGYHRERLAGQTPQDWGALFDTRTFPGKRALYKWPSPGVLEMALLADGVPAGELYPLDLDRAFRKLDSIKADIVWWGSGEESQRLLTSGEASLGQFWNGRVFALQRQGEPVSIGWQQNLVGGDFLVIPRGAPNREQAQRFIGFATGAQAQAKLASLTGYAPVNGASEALLDPTLLANLPSAHAAQQVSLDFKYWGKHGEEIAERWNRWQSQ